MNRYEWDENKNNKNIETHGIDFNDAPEFFENPYLTRIDNRKNYGEIRHIALGQLFEVVVVTIFTIRKGAIRIISMRKANRNERKIYEESTQE